MSRNGEVQLGVELAWGDGNHRFRLSIAELEELQEKCDAGPAYILTRLATQRWRTQDVFETLRLGLIGGGLSPPESLALVKRYGHDRPVAESVLPAIAVLSAAIQGAPDEPLDDDDTGDETGKAPTVPDETVTPSAEKSVSPRSTPAAP